MPKFAKRIMLRRLGVLGVALLGSLTFVAALTFPGTPQSTERSRSTPVSGLGLAPVAAVERLHGADVSLEDARPGLTVRIRFPR